MLTLRLTFSKLHPIFSAINLRLCARNQSGVYNNV